MDVMTAFVLKIIASVTMLVDHTGAIFDTPAYFRMIGRIAFPIYAYMIAQGCLYTKDINKYFLRLFIFALISQIPFSYAFFHGYQQYTNIFFTLALGVGCVVIYEKVKSKTNRWIAFIPALPLLPFADFIKTDYGMAGVSLIFFLYLAGPENRAARAVVLTAGMLWIYVLDGFLEYHVIGLSSWTFFAFSMVSVVLVLLYNGKQGPKVRWFFYVFYPAHITALGLIRYFM